MWQYYAMKLVSKITMLLPGRCKLLLGAALGRLFWLAVPAWRKRLATGQARDCLGVDESRARQIVRDSVVRYGDMIVEVLCFPLFNKDNIKDKVVFQDERALKALCSENAGLVLAGAHFGNWELHCAALALYGYKVAAMAQRQHNAALDKFINEYRALPGARIVYRTGVLELTRLLGEGYGIGLLTDQDGGQDGVTVDFFGRPSSCHKGPAVLARLKKVPLALTLMKKRADGRHEIFISPPIDLEYSSDKENDIKKATAALMLLIENEIKKEPEMWFWLHNRWKVSRDFYSRTG